MSMTLFTPVTLDTLQLPHRCIRSATWEGMADANGDPTAQLLEHYRTLVRGNVGLIITGYVAVDPLALQFPKTLRLDDDSRVAPMRALPEAVHAAGGRVLAQLFHGGGQTGPKALGRPGLAPSAVAFPSYDGIPEAMSEAQITDTIAAFGQAARRAREADFDGVQLHAAHGYLIHQFLSPLTNQRTDGWGGTPGGRLRFLLAVCAAVRAAAGADFPLWVKLNGDDNRDGGMTLADSILVAKALAAAGVGVIEVSAGSPASGAGSPVRSAIRAGVNEGYNVPLAAAIRKEVSIPVITVGGLRSLATIDQLLADGAADAVALSRPLIREPDLLRRWQEGDHRPATCVSCNGCFRPGLKGLGIRCTIDHPLK